MPDNEYKETLPKPVKDKDLESEISIKQAEPSVEQSDRQQFEFNSGGGDEMICESREGEGYEHRYYRASELRILGSVTDPVIEGHAALFDKSSEDLGGFTEKISKGAFTRTLANGADVRALFNHDANMILGRTKNKTLELWEDDAGLGFRLKADPEITYVANLIRSIKRGDITQNSFGFRVVRDLWSKDNKRRTLEEVELFDISPVTFPAYPQTKVKVRSFEELRKVGIDIERLNLIRTRKDEGIDLSLSDIEEIRTTITILQSFLPESINIEHSTDVEHSKDPLEKHSNEDLQEIRTEDPPAENETKGNRFKILELMKKKREIKAKMEKGQI